MNDKSCVNCIHKDVCFRYRLNFAIVREGNCTNYYENPKKGKWIKINPEARGYAEFFRCSNCLSNVQYSYCDKECEYDYCPNCGADMRGDKHGTN